MYSDVTYSKHYCISCLIQPRKGLFSLVFGYNAKIKMNVITTPFKQKCQTKLITFPKKQLKETNF